MGGHWLTSSSTLWHVLYSVLLGVHEREMRKKKRNEVLPNHGFSLCFVLVLCNLGVPVDALPFWLRTLIKMNINETIMREQGRGVEVRGSFTLYSFGSFILIAVAAVFIIAVPLMWNPL